MSIDNILKLALLVLIFRVVYRWLILLWYIIRGRGVKGKIKGVKREERSTSSSYYFNVRYEYQDQEGKDQEGLLYLLLPGVL